MNDLVLNAPSPRPPYEYLGVSGVGDAHLYAKRPTWSKLNDQLDGGWRFKAGTMPSPLAIYLPMMFNSTLWWWDKLLNRWTLMEQQLPDVTRTSVSLEVIRSLLERETPFSVSYANNTITINTEPGAKDTKDPQ